MAKHPETKKCPQCGDTMELHEGIDSTTQGQGGRIRDDGAGTMRPARRARYYRCRADGSHLEIVEQLDD